MLFRQDKDLGEEDEKMNAFRLVINSDGVKNMLICGQISKPISNAQQPGFIIRLQRVHNLKFTCVGLIIY